MLFQLTWEWILTPSPHTGELKTQTRRIVKPSEFYWYDFATLEGGSHCVCVHPDNDDSNTRIVYQCKKTYAVQPGRGQPAIIYNPNHPCYGIDIIEPGDQHYALAKRGEWRYEGQGYQQARILITDIRREDVRNISDEDVKAEGFSSRLDFLATWISMHDKGIWLNRTDIPTRGMRPGDWYMHSTERGKKWHQDSASDEFIHSKIAERPAANYDAWALTFELVKEASRKHA